MRYDGILIMVNLPQLKADKMAGKSKKQKFKAVKSPFLQVKSEIIFP